jgi:hypothetical protein
MARIRTIKPEFWTDERVGECSVSARLLFIACWNFSDDYGGLDRSAKQLKAQAFPYDAIDCEPLVQELLNVGLLVEYTAGGKTYLHINGFRKHQKVEKPAKPRIPLYEESMKPHRGLPDSSPTSSGSSLGREGKGNGREAKNPSASATPTRSTKPPNVPHETDGWFLDFKIAYPTRSGDHGWRKALRAAHARILEGHTPEEFIEGAKRYAEFCRLTGKQGTEFVKQAATFLGPDKPFLEPWNPPATKADVRLAGNLSAAEDFMRRTEGVQ